LRLPRVGPSSSREHAERFRRLVGHEHVDAPKRLAGLDLFADKMAALVVLDPRATWGLKTPGHGPWELRRVRLVPRRRECSPESRDPHPWGRRFSSGHHKSSIRDVMKIRRKIARSYGVEVVVIAVDPVDG